MTRALLLLPLLLVGGCISLLPKPPPPPRLYVLEAGDVQRVQGAPIDAVLGVAMPEGERVILGADLIWRTGDTLAYVDQSQWSGRTQSSLQAVVTEIVTRQGRFRAAVRAGNARSDYDVRWDVLDFEVVEAGGSMTAHFRADVKVVDAMSRRVLAAEIVSTEAQIASRSSSAAADGLARAAREGGARIGLFAADAVTAELARLETETATPEGAAVNR
jgi:cholesterol transport system auxiliary component